MNMFKKNGGFTLVELIVVIAILAILAAVAVPAYNGYISKAQDAGVTTALSAIKTAAMGANATAGEIESITVDAAGTTVTIKGKTALSDKFAADFKMFYDAATKVDVKDATATVTIPVIDGWANSSFAKAPDKDHTAGATWTATSTNGWSVGVATSNAGGNNQNQQQNPEGGEGA
jgi:type IV pilus assembly protein PilA